MIKIYRKQPIEAEQFDGSSDLFMKYDMIDIGTMCEERNSPEIYMPRIHRKVSIGDWIITDNFNHHTLMTGKEFQQQYAELPVIPRNVNIYIQSSQIHDLPIGHAFMFAKTLDKDAFSWIVNNSDVFARAWLDGYTVEDHD